MSIAKKLVDLSAPTRIRFRQKRIQPFLNLIRNVYQQKGEVRILDLGGTREYWNIFPENFLNECNVTVTVVNFASVAFEQQQRITFYEGNACSLPMLQNNSFDVVHSNSVIEHVGRWEQMCQFAQEARRLAPRHWIQTPYYWFPVEPHFMTPFYHWLPWSWRVKMLQRFDLGNWKRCPNLDDAVRAIESSVLLDTAMFRHLFPDSTLRVERVMLCAKSLIAVRE